MSLIVVLEFDLPLSPEDRAGVRELCRRIPRALRRRSRGSHAYVLPEELLPVVAAIWPEHTPAVARPVQGALL